MKSRGRRKQKGFTVLIHASTYKCVNEKANELRCPLWRDEAAKGGGEGKESERKEWKPVVQLADLVRRTQTGWKK